MAAKSKSQKTIRSKPQRRKMKKHSIKSRLLLRASTELHQM